MHRGKGLLKIEREPLLHCVAPCSLLCFTCPGLCDGAPASHARSFFNSVNAVIGGDWERGSRRIREVGAERYLEENKDSSHYKSYKKQ